MDYIDRELKKDERAKSPLSYLTFMDYSPAFVPSIHDTFWHTKTLDRITELGNSIEWLKIQEKQLKTQESLLAHPEGMKLGLAIFSIFSICGIILPLTLAPFSTDDFVHYITTKIIILALFSVNLAAIFAYYIYLLKWKKR